MKVHDPSPRSPSPPGGEGMSADLSHTLAPLGRGLARSDGEGSFVTTLSDDQ